MPALALGLIVLILLLFAAYSFSKADPKQAARVLRYIGGGAALLFAIFLLIRGAIMPAVSIGLIGLGLLGAALDDLDVRTLISLLGEIDQDSASLLVTYLDRRQPNWREHAPDDSAAANGGHPSRTSKMTEQEAYQILGIQPGASAQDITRAHRSLIKKLHPDQGGSTYLAAQINEAKDVLTRGAR
jgi:hypothetical protein